jgi:hypothetical protein
MSGGLTPDAQVLGGGFARKRLSGHVKCCVTSEKSRATLCNTANGIKHLPRACELPARARCATFWVSGSIAQGIVVR